MANVDPIFLGTTQNVGETITAADTTTKKTVVTAGTDGGAVVSLSAVNFDAANPVVILLSVNDGAASTQLGAVTVAAAAGTDGVTAAVNLLDTALIPSLQADGSFILEANHSFEVAALATVSGNVDIAGIAGNY